MDKIRIIDLFAGCGGLLDGFLATELYETVASVEWEKAPTNTLKNRLNQKWGIKNTDESVIRFDIQRIEELFSGFVNDAEYGSNQGLDTLVGEKSIDGIIGGPPCQSYSVAGRIRDKDKMKEDYRNYLFEYYLKIVDQYKPNFFIFENVPGMLSAMPDGTPITDLIKRDISEKGYEIVEDIKKNAIIDTSDYGVPQKRKRVILLGLNKEKFKGKDIQKILIEFYDEILPKYKSEKKSVFDAIHDLPACYPLEDIQINNGRRYSHSIPEADITWHIPRFQNKRDIEIFKILSKDIEIEEYKYTDSKILREMYNKATGSDTQVHKYHVLRKDNPSTTILAHLYKDGLRFIHYDSKQARTITVREAARLQSFDDDFEFIGTMGDAFKMIGNAVPPKFSNALGKAVFKFLDKYIDRGGKNGKFFR